MSDSSWPNGLPHTRFLCPSLSPGVCPSSCPLYQWCHPAISTSVTLFSFCLQFFPASGSFPMSRLFASGDQSIGASASASVLPKSCSVLISFEMDWFDLCFPRDSQESSPAPQFESINSLVLCLLYGPALTTVHDYWKDHSLDYTDICRQSDVFPFKHTVYVCHTSNKYLSLCARHCFKKTNFDTKSNKWKQRKTDVGLTNCSRREGAVPGSSELAVPGGMQAETGDYQDASKKWLYYMILKVSFILDILWLKCFTFQDLPWGLSGKGGVLGSKDRRKE